MGFLGDLRWEMRKAWRTAWEVQRQIWTQVLLALRMGRRVHPHTGIQIRYSKMATVAPSPEIPNETCRRARLSTNRIRTRIYLRSTICTCKFLRVTGYRSVLESVF